MLSEFSLTTANLSYSLLDLEEFALKQPQPMLSKLAFILAFILYSKLKAGPLIMATNKGCTQIQAGKKTRVDKLLIPGLYICMPAEHNVHFYHIFNNIFQ